ncbi:MAG TPA: class I SAM-dependent methyltransferase [Gammaproteobacteria bacterium]|nr:class I SAM-dependent methyltransferase [Gammaproteobacteria bacterium]
MNTTASSTSAIGYKLPSRDIAGKKLWERAYPGLHAEILEQFLVHIKMLCPVLDLACGTGAWLARLQSHGFRDVIGMDRGKEDFGLDPSLFVHTDLDGAFGHAVGRTFDVITAMEIIEHLESPAGFLREARKLINPGGYMFVTTPNVECTQGRLRFLLQGQLRAFEADGTADPTHISPLLSTLLPRLTERSGWKIQERIPLLTNTSRLGVRLFCQLLNPFLKGAAKQGDCHLFILRPA